MGEERRKIACPAGAEQYRIWGQSVVEAWQGQVCESRVVENLAHGRDLRVQSGRHDRVDGVSPIGALRNEIGHGAVRVGRQAETVRAIQRLEEHASVERPVKVDLM